MRNRNFDPTTPYHITSRCINKEWFEIPMPDAWRIFATNLKFVSYSYQIDIFAFVLMNNHFHLLAKAPNGNFSEGVGKFIEMSSRHMGHDAGRINQKFARRFKPSRISSLQYYYNAYKYIYQNPIRAGLVTKVEDYPFSTLSGLMGKSEFWVPVDDETFMNDPEGTLLWLNQIPDENNTNAVRLALRRNEFKYPRLSCKKRTPEDFRL